MSHSKLIFVSGSSDGLGFLTAQQLIANGHHVHLHARNEQRKKEIERRLRGYACVHVADFEDQEAFGKLAKTLTTFGTFDSIIHNAGVYNSPSAVLFQVNVLAPYLLTALTPPPKKLIYVSSDMHLGGVHHLNHLQNGKVAINYSDSKLLLLLLSMAVARHWSSVLVNALHPGWVPTKMGGNKAPDDLEQGFQTQIWLSTSTDNNAQVSGRYFFHKKESRYHLDADNTELQDQLLSVCSTFTGITFPTNGYE